MKISLVLILLVCIAYGGCPFKSNQNRRVTQQSRFLSDLISCPTTASQKTLEFTENDYNLIEADFHNLFNQIDETCEGNICPRADFAGCLLRLAGHDLMDFRVQSENTGGSDGCINFNEADNTGLDDCIANGNISLQTSYSKFCHKVSLADFVVLAAEIMMAKLSTDPIEQSVAFKNDFMFGRTTAQNCEWNQLRMPDPENGCDGLKALFVDHIYSAHREIVGGSYNTDMAWILTAAISGAHTLGKAEIKNSGYNGWWSDIKNSAKFNNNYYKSIVMKGWGPQVAVNGNQNKNQWIRVDAGVSKDFQEMMLDTDMCLAFKRIEGAQAKQLHSDQGQCCSWIFHTSLQKLGIPFPLEDYCGIKELGSTQAINSKNVCCVPQKRGQTWVDCDAPSIPNGDAWGAVVQFMKDENEFLKYFHKAWYIATTNGYFRKNKHELKFMIPKQQENIDTQTLCSSFNNNKRTKMNNCQSTPNCIWSRSSNSCSGIKSSRTLYSWGYEEGDIKQTIIPVSQNRILTAQAIYEYHNSSLFLGSILSLLLFVIVFKYRTKQNLDIQITETNQNEIY